jgi:hypothetical protein
MWYFQVFYWIKTLKYNIKQRKSDIISSGGAKAPLFVYIECLMCFDNCENDYMEVKDYDDDRK